ncbi:hypothetical protein Tco_1058210 [Tanacetum coccineum]|uniref:Retrotransposon gag domain-containing protein n=1 Tax=Tanacetum coccineum TaxID=301880 RepID=A0ABQ5H7N3_9ASTR
MIVEKPLVLEMLVDESLEMIVDKSFDIIVDESLDMIVDESLDMIMDESLDMIVDESLMVEDKSLKKLVNETLKLDEEHFKFVIADCDLDNSTNNVLIPLDSWTSGLLVYRLPLSVDYGISNSTEYDVSSSLSNTAYSSQQINTVYPLPLDTAYRFNDIEIELNEKFWAELQKNIYQGTYNEDVVEHIARVLKLVDLIYVPCMDSHQLRMKVLPLLLADDAKEWWTSEGDGKITTWEELVEKFFCRFYPESYDGDDEMLDEGENWGIDPLEFLSNNKRYVDSNTSSNNEWPSNTAIDSFFKAYDVRNIEKENEQGQTNRKDINNDDKQPNKRRCKTEKFEAIKYSIGPNEEYIAIRSYEYDIWEKNKYNLSIIYQDIFQKKDEGWKVTRTKK